jgi:hypothetical protein
MSAVLEDEVMDEARLEIIRTEISLKIWMVCIATVEVAVMAHGFKWI